MKMTWANKNTSPQQAAGRAQLALWDFLKMLFAAVICGVVVSIVGAGLAVLLAQDAYAITFAPFSGAANTNEVKVDEDASTSMQTSSGMLFIGDGCGSEADIVDAVERDWKVTINGKNIDVRVMQAFIMPDNEAMAATFGALLPSGAALETTGTRITGLSWSTDQIDSERRFQLAWSM